MNMAFGEPTMAVDTHVFRVSNRIGLVRAKNPIETEKQLFGDHPARVWHTRTPLADPARALPLQSSQTGVLALSDPGPMPISGQDTSTRAIRLPMREPFTIGGQSITPGERKLVILPVSKLSNHTPVTLPVHVLHGKQPGPAMFVSAAVHGDELNGVEIIRRVLRALSPTHIKGTLLCVPIVNAFGFIGRSRVSARQARSQPRVSRLSQRLARCTHRAPLSE